MNDKTKNFERDFQEIDIQMILKKIVIVLEKNGYDPYDQIVGYLLSGEPSYIPRNDNARNLIKTIERDKIIEFLLREFLNE